MQGDKYYSVRMRASKNGPHEQGGKHISGGERLTSFSGLKGAVHTLLDKALSHSRGEPDFMQIQFECVDEPVSLIQPLPVETHEVDAAENGRALARALLQKAGVPASMFEKALQDIALRGAVLFDIDAGERIDGRHEKGVRVSRIDWPEDDFQKWARERDMPLNPRLKEALAIAAKVCAHPDIIAELCWSDDPDYITGYVASRKLGYRRMTKMKEYGDESGCRIFFVRGFINAENCIDYLENQPVLIQTGGEKWGNR
ncbi:MULTISPECIES: 6-carboxyhexanoate--CoA ligase [Bacillus]|uniref:6-carboxyhexanoate--CoA ligase n=1 Tax=Bacillus TaxID=1386 RepID=UPI0003FBF43D|nr:MULTISPECIES: 6-carboxyhexanoate--CoA ligase [Bacillus]QHZ48319.1 6-carboxyhexanoate--CoA ligase [Bacillus sp. NSP9.1]WFA06018.1 6-carboxyhexanoate--CoA ligase [Bacillus sp. HSf4]